MGDRLIMPEKNPTDFNKIASQIRGELQEGQEEIPALTTALERLTEEQTIMQSEIARITRRIDGLTISLNIDSYLFELEERAVIEKNLGLFVLAREMRMPSFDPEDPTPRADMRKMRSWQTDQLQRSLTKASMYEELNSALRENEESQPFIRLHGFDFGLYRHQRLGEVEAGWTKPKKAVQLATHELSEEGEVQGITINYRESDLVLPVGFSARFFPVSGFDDEDWGYNFIPQEGEISLLSGEPALKIPKDKEPRRRVMPLSPGYEEGFLVGRKQCDEFIDSLGRWEQGEQMQSVVRSLIKQQLTFDEAKQKSKIF